MLHLAIAVFCGLALAAVGHLVLAALVMPSFFRAACANTAVERFPRVSILVSLRGADAGLLDNLRSLMQQRYPCYDLRVVVDRLEDPAWKVAEAAIHSTGAPHVHLAPLRERRPTCSLKCSALVQACRDLDDACEVIALADGDLAAHPDWLRELVAPLQDERVGVTFGNRWYMPRCGQWGSLVRYLWNAAAVLLMSHFSIPWAGTLAIRRSLLLPSGLLEKWGAAVVDDAPLPALLRNLGQQLKFVPALMMVNREECSLAASYEFIKRQLFWTRTYHATWIPLLSLVLAVTFLLLSSVALTVYGLLASRWDVAVWAGGGLGTHYLLMLWLLGTVEVGVRRVVRRRGEATAWVSPRVLWRLVPALVLTEIVYLAATLSAHFQEYVVWRGVTYHVRGPWDVRLVADPPIATADGGLRQPLTSQRDESP